MHDAVIWIFCIASGLFVLDIVGDFVLKRSLFVAIFDLLLWVVGKVFIDG